MSQIKAKGKTFSDSASEDSTFPSDSNKSETEEIQTDS